MKLLDGDVLPGDTLTVDADMKRGGERRASVRKFARGWRIHRDLCDVCEQAIPGCATEDKLALGQQRSYSPVRQVLAAVY
jgi:hypothetical protein